MNIKFKNFLNEKVDDPLFAHNIRMEHGYRPKYKSGLIAIRFIDDDVPYGKEFKDVDGSGKMRVDYQDIFSSGESDFIKFFERKYGIKMAKYRKGTDDYHFYFTCKPGEEERKMMELSNDDIIKDLDFVDARGLENVEILDDLIRRLEYFRDEYTELNTQEQQKRINDFIETLKSLT